MAGVFGHRLRGCLMGRDARIKFLTRITRLIDNPQLVDAKAARLSRRNVARILRRVLLMPDPLGLPDHAGRWTVTPKAKAKP